MDHRSRDYEEEARAAFLPRVPAGDDHPLADATPSVPSSSSARPAPRPSRPSAPPRSDDRVARSRDPLGASSDPLGAVPANRADSAPGARPTAASSDADADDDDASDSDSDASDSSSSSASRRRPLPAAGGPDPSALVAWSKFRASVHAEHAPDRLDSARARLALLEDPAAGARAEADARAARDAVARLARLETDLSEAWTAGDRVRALTLAIDAAGVLALERERGEEDAGDWDEWGEWFGEEFAEWFFGEDEFVAAERRHAAREARTRAYPLAFVAVADCLDAFAALVFQRIRRQCDWEDDGRRVDEDEALPSRPGGDFTSDDVRDAAKRTCENWRRKVADIRRLVPRVMVEAALMRLAHFTQRDPPTATLERLVAECERVADPLAAAYVRAYVARQGWFFCARRDPERTRRAMESLLGDHCAASLGGTSSEARLALMDPALGWLVRCASRGADAAATARTLDAARGGGGRGGVGVVRAAAIRAVLDAAPRRAVAACAERVAESFRAPEPPAAATNGRFAAATAECVRALGETLARRPPRDLATRDRVARVAWAAIRRLPDADDAYLTPYLRCVDAWTEVVFEEDRAAEDARAGGGEGDLFREMLRDASRRLEAFVDGDAFEPASGASDAEDALGWGGFAGRDSGSTALDEARVALASSLATRALARARGGLASAIRGDPGDAARTPFVALFDLLRENAAGRGAAEARRFFERVLASVAPPEGPRRNGLGGAQSRRKVFARDDGRRDDGLGLRDPATLKFAFDAAKAMRDASEAVRVASEGTEASSEASARLVARFIRAGVRAVEHRHRELEDLGAFDDDERNVSISVASSGSIAGSRSLVGAFASALDFLAACRAAFPSLRLAQEAVAHAAIRIAAEAGSRSRPPGRSRSRSRRPSTIAVEAIAFCQITIPSLGERRTRLHLYLAAAEAALRRRLPSQAESLVRASIADAAADASEDADADASEDASEDASDEGASDRLTDADFLEYVRTCASALAYLPGHPSGVNVLRVPEGLRRVVDARRFRDGGRVGAAATAIRARVALIRLSAALAQRRTPYRVRGVASNAEMFFSSTLARAPGAIREEEEEAEEEEEEEEEFVEEEEEADGDGGRGHPGDDRSGDDGDDRWSAAYASEALAFTHALVEAATGEAQRAGEGDRDAAGAALDLAEAVESCLAPTPEIRRLAEALRARVAEKVRQELV